MCEMFNNNDIQQQLSLKKAFDKKNLLNPGKVYPILHRCEEGRIHIHKGKTKFPDLPRFLMNDIYSPVNEKEVSDFIYECHKDLSPIEIIGNNSKKIGRVIQCSKNVMFRKD